MTTESRQRHVRAGIEVKDLPDVAGRDPRESLGWLAVGVITLLVALTWFPLVNAAFGDSHDSRGLSRLALLHVRNFEDRVSAARTSQPTGSRTERRTRTTPRWPTS
jgi:hypothetical protein